MASKNLRLEDFYHFSASGELNKRGQQVNYWFGCSEFDAHKRGEEVLPPRLYLFLEVWKAAYGHCWKFNAGFASSTGSFS